MAPVSPPSWQQLLDLIATLDSGEYDAVAISFGDVSVQLSRSGPIDAASPAATAAATAAVTHASPASPPAPVESDLSAEPAGAAITAPMLGVFYRRPGPGAAPFVEPGDRVEPDTTIGIIEIMKLMNPVSAGVSGVLAGFAVDDGAPVQFGQVLARLEV